MATGTPGGSAPRRANLGIHFRCCHVYGYIYKNKQGDAFTGRCPKCGMPIRVEIARNGQGSPSRIFQTG
ncbi:MAG: hypothetical protein LIQ31_02850 [Planctomycetes bacterium]|nr:hypothetical protein [Planctomycetota bacterium]